MTLRNGLRRLFPRSVEQVSPPPYANPAGDAEAAARAWAACAGDWFWLVSRGFLPKSFWSARAATCPGPWAPGQPEPGRTARQHPHTGGADWPTSTRRDRVLKGTRPRTFPDWITDLPLRPPAHRLRPTAPHRAAARGAPRPTRRMLFTFLCRSRAGGLGDARWTPPQNKNRGRGSVGNLASGDGTGNNTRGAGRCRLPRRVPSPPPIKRPLPLAAIPRRSQAIRTCLSSN